MNGVCCSVFSVPFPSLFSVEVRFEAALGVIRAIAPAPVFTLRTIKNNQRFATARTKDFSFSLVIAMRETVYCACEKIRDMALLEIHPAEFFPSYREASPAKIIDQITTDAFRSFFRNEYDLDFIMVL